MSLKATPVPPVPEDTARVARTAFRKGKGSPWIALRDELGSLYQDSDFSSLFAIEGRPAEAPWRLALVTCFQFAEGLSDLQAADAVRSRIDWKYALSLPLDSPGFDDSVLSDTRRAQASKGRSRKECGAVTCGERATSDKQRPICKISARQ